MDLEEIKRGLRAEIKKRENEQYLTFQCNVRQMCKDVLAKLEEQESVIAELEKRIDDGDKDFEMADHQNERLLKIVRHQKCKRCLNNAEICKARYDEEDAKVNGCGASWEYISPEMKYWERWRWRWLELAEKLKEAK